ncbi:hypothetical protein D3C78_1231830 [compost metagenome]
MVAQQGRELAVHAGHACRPQGKAGQDQQQRTPAAAQRRALPGHAPPQPEAGQTAPQRDVPQHARAQQGQGLAGIGLQHIAHHAAVQQDAVMLDVVLHAGGRQQAGAPANAPHAGPGQQHEPPIGRAGDQAGDGRALPEPGIDKIRHPAQPGPQRRIEHQRAPQREQDRAPARRKAQLPSGLRRTACGHFGSRSGLGC